MKKIAIIGASYLQIPLIRKAKEMGLETHVFAWKCGDPGETEADYFYPISITEKEEILKCCKEIGIHAICSIASDLAVHVVNYVADRMGLVGNSLHSTEISTNKYQMRKAFVSKGVPSPVFFETTPDSIDDISDIEFPVIVKPEDRSGSRGVTKVFCRDDLLDAIKKATEYGFVKKALIEGYIQGKEYSVECISYKGVHHLLAITEKFTTGEPHFIETGHMEPAVINPCMYEQIQKIIFHALDVLEVEYGASHSEIKIDDDGSITVVEIGARMGGDFIGSDLVFLSTGIDFIKAVIDVSMGIEPVIDRDKINKCAAVHFITESEDIKYYEKVMKEHPEFIVSCDISDDKDYNVVDSSSRHGYFMLKASSREELEPYMPALK